MVSSWMIRNDRNSCVDHDGFMYTDVWWWCTEWHGETWQYMNNPYSKAPVALLDILYEFSPRPSAMHSTDYPHENRNFKCRSTDKTFVCDMKTTPRRFQRCIIEKNRQDIAGVMVVTRSNPSASCHAPRTKVWALWCEYLKYARSDDLHSCHNVITMIKRMWFSIGFGFRDPWMKLHMVTQDDMLWWYKRGEKSSFGSKNRYRWKRWTRKP